MRLCTRTHLLRVWVSEDQNSYWTHTSSRRAMPHLFQRLTRNPQTVTIDGANESSRTKGRWVDKGELPVRLTDSMYGQRFFVTPP